MCTSSKMHVDSAFRVSPVMKVPCSSVSGHRHTQGIFKSCVLQHPSIGELSVCHSSDTSVFEMTSVVFGKFVYPSLSVCV